MPQKGGKYSMKINKTASNYILLGFTTAKGLGFSKTTIINKLSTITVMGNGGLQEK